MINLLIFYGFGVIMGTIISEPDCSKAVKKRSRSELKRPIPLVKRRPFLPWEGGIRK